MERQKPTGSTGINVWIGDKSGSELGGIDAMRLLDVASWKLAFSVYVLVETSLAAFVILFAQYQQTP